MDGWSDHPADPGGATMKGITLATYRRYKPDATKADLRRISDAMVRKIYKQYYWDKVQGDRLAAGADLATFDYAVNSGHAAAWKSLMKVVGGPDHETVKKICARSPVDLSNAEALEGVRQGLDEPHRRH